MGSNQRMEATCAPRGATRSRICLCEYVVYRNMDYGGHLLFCQQYPTATCVVGNDGVRSVRDNATLDRKVRRPNRERKSTLPASHGGREPGWKGMVNRREVPLNVVTQNRRKRPIRLTQTGELARSGGSRVLQRRCRVTGEEAPPTPFNRDICATW